MACILCFTSWTTPVNAATNTNKSADKKKTSTKKTGSEQEKKKDEEDEYEPQQLFYSPDTLCGLAGKMYLEDMMLHYGVNITEDRKYADFEGDIGDVIPEYKNVDLDGDGKPDPIKRKGTRYSIKFSDGGTLKTHDFSDYPNETQVIEFADLSEDGVDEILIAHYTDGTGGPSVWDTALYSRIDGKWTAFPIVDEEGYINCKELTEHIEARTGEKYDPWGLRIAGIQLTDSAVEMLLDYGYKEGPGQVFDYEAVTIFKAFDPRYLNNYEGFTLLETGVEDMVRNWPFQCSGKDIKLSSDLQYKANIFLSNFSEQHYRGNPDYSPAEYAHFVMEWMEVNKPRELTLSGDYTWLSHEQINKTLGRYFGSNLTEGDFYGAGVNNLYGGIIKEGKDGKSYYCEPLADGEMYKNNGFSVVSSIEDLGSENTKDPTKNRYLRMNFTVYAMDADAYDKTGIGKKQYSLTGKEAEKLASKKELYERESGFAIVYEPTPGEYWLMHYFIEDEED